jgi:hypothetical protein
MNREGEGVGMAGPPVVRRAGVAAAGGPRVEERAGEVAVNGA